MLGLYKGDLMTWLLIVFEKPINVFFLDKSQVVLYCYVFQKYINVFVYVPAYPCLQT